MKMKTFNMKFNEQKPNERRAYDVYKDIPRGVAKELIIEVLLSLEGMTGAEIRELACAMQRNERSLRSIANSKIDDQHKENPSKNMKLNDANNERFTKEQSEENPFGELLR